MKHPSSIHYVNLNLIPNTKSTHYHYDLFSTPVNPFFFYPFLKIKSLISIHVSSINNTSIIFIDIIRFTTWITNKEYIDINHFGIISFYFHGQLIKFNSIYFFPLILLIINHLGIISFYFYKTNHLQLNIFLWLKNKGFG